jgi:hypothetical protein
MTARSFGRLQDIVFSFWGRDREAPTIFFNPDQPATAIDLLPSAPADPAERPLGLLLFDRSFR